MMSLGDCCDYMTVTCFALGFWLFILVISFVNMSNQFDWLILSFGDPCLSSVSGSGGGSSGSSSSSSGSSSTV